MDYSKFFTPPDIAEMLVREVDISEPNMTVDICCGSCNLLFAAKNRWPSIQLIGVDINEQITNGIDCICADGRKYAIEHKGEFTLVLANPPFATIEVKNEYPRLSEGIFNGYNTSRLENEMLLANLRLLNDNGTLVIIMPSTFVEGEKNQKLRSALATVYSILKIIRLPNETFGSAQIRSHAVYIRKNNCEEQCTIFYDTFANESGYTLSKGIAIQSEEVRLGNWTSQPTMVQYPNIDIRRGTISSSSFIDYGIPVLHTSRAQDQWEPSVRYILEVPKNPVYAERGDILVSRIGKSAGQWTTYGGERVLISDCIFRIKDPEGQMRNRMHNVRYSYKVKGVSTPYITAGDFAAWYHSI